MALWDLRKREMREKEEQELVKIVFLFTFPIREKVKRE